MCSSLMYPRWFIVSCCTQFKIEEKGGKKWKSCPVIYFWYCYYDGFFRFGSPQVYHGLKWPIQGESVVKNVSWHGRWTIVSNYRFYPFTPPFLVAKQKTWLHFVVLHSEIHFFKRKVKNLIKNCWYFRNDNQFDLVTLQNLNQKSIDVLQAFEAF